MPGTVSFNANLNSTNVNRISHTQVWRLQWAYRGSLRTR